MLMYRRSFSPALRMEDGVAKVRLADDEYPIRFPNYVLFTTLLVVVLSGYKTKELSDPFGTTFVAVNEQKGFVPSKP